MKLCSLLLNFLTICVWIYSDAVADSNPPVVYGKLHDLVFLKISKKLEKGEEVTWKISDKLIGKFKTSPQTSKPSTCLLPNNGRCQIFDNGTLRIDQLKKYDETIYTVEIFDLQGHSRIEHFNLTVLESVSLPNVSSVCLENNIVLSCEVNNRGSPKMSLFLEDKLLENSREIPTTKMTKQVKKSNSWNSFKCITQNKVSEKSAQMNISCPSEINLIFILSIAGGAVVFVSFLSLIIYCLRRRTRTKPKPGKETELSTMEPLSRGIQRQLPEPPRQLPEPPCKLPEPPRQLPEPSCKLPEPPRQLPEPPRKHPEPPIRHPHIPQLQQKKQNKPRRQIKKYEQSQPPKEKPQLSLHHSGPQQQQEARPLPRTKQKLFDYYVEES
ncbi:T-cell surface antigen CD2 isoform X2 [Microcaecilia unicolor]|uniref:T-cell surface antigen CD2-like isoform X2 n=1 Tax=Microcaecilia unicolor TaxID=1415580 RepID=A0A6P7YDS7_9AMPH|nr:T-cell surface antigen CD2-like isoform X2 [Microcaecilia unicolor]